MEMIADGLLIAGALAAALYCWILSVRVKGLKDLDQGLGAAIASLSTQVNDMRATLKTTQASAGASADALKQSTEAADAAAARLEKLLGAYSTLNTPAAATRVPEPAPDPVPQQRAPERPAATAEPASRAKMIQRKIQSVKQQVTPESRPAAVHPATPPQREPTQHNSVESAAQKLQENIRERVSGRSDGGNKDDFVKALQSVLAAANK